MFEIINNRNPGRIYSLLLFTMFILVFECCNPVNAPPPPVNEKKELHISITHADFDLLENRRYDFGKIGINVSGELITFMIRNTGTVEIRFRNIVLEKGIDFIINNGIVNSELKPGAELSFSVQFNPQSEGEKKDILEIASVDPGYDRIKIDISGTGINGPLCFINENADSFICFDVIDFDRLNLKQKEAAKQFYISNRGTMELDIFSFSIMDDEENNFSFADTYSFPLPIAVGEHQEINLQFHPHSAGIKNAVLKIESNDTFNSYSGIPLKGLAISGPEMHVKINEIEYNRGDICDFGAISFGCRKSETLIIENLGTENLIIESVNKNNGNTDDFVIDITAFNTGIAVDESSPLIISYNPRVLDLETKTCEIIITSNDNNSSPFSFSVKGKSNLGTPGINPDEGRNTEYIHISLTSVAGADLYYFYKSDQRNTNNYELVKIAQSGFYDYNVIPGRSYYYRAKAYNSELDLFSDFSFTERGYSKLSAPENVQAAEGEYENKVIISWNPVPGSDRYYILRANRIIGNTTRTSYDDSPPCAGDEYEYKIYAYSESSQSQSEYSRTTYGFMKLPSPDSIQATDGTNVSAISITWTAVPRASSYDVYKSNSGNNYSFLKTVNSNSSGDDTVPPGEWYYYKVKAYSGSSRSYSEFSPADRGFRKLNEPEINIPCFNCPYPYIPVNWTKVNSADEYYLYRDGSLLVRTTSTSYKDYNTDPDDRYYYKVKAYSSKTSSFSDFSREKEGFRQKQ